jgi:hypothetical protein
MSRRIKTLIISLGLLVLLAGGYYGSTVYQRRKAEADWPVRTPSPRLGNLDSSKLVRIEIPGIILEKTGDTWELVSYEGNPPPSGLVLDQSQIRSLTWSFATIWVDQVVEEEPEDISVYGLDNPFARMLVADSDGNQVVYIMGDMTPSRTAYYLMEEGLHFLLLFGG